MVLIERRISLRQLFRACFSPRVFCVSRTCKLSLPIVQTSPCWIPRWHAYIIVRVRNTQRAGNMFIGSFFLEKLVTTTSAVYLFENISMELHSSDFMRTKLFNWVRKIAKKKTRQKGIGYHGLVYVFSSKPFLYWKQKIAYITRNVKSCG